MGKNNKEKTEIAVFATIMKITLCITSGNKIKMNSIVKGVVCKESSYFFNIPKKTTCRLMNLSKLAIHRYVRFENDTKILHFLTYIDLLVQKLYFIKVDLI